MAKANVARRQGDDFQARLFWLNAASLLDPHSSTISVAYETGPKSFDDIRIEFDPQKPPQDHEGKSIYRKHLQCKWHTTAGSFGYQDLIDPAFINAERFSILQRAHKAQVQHGADGFGYQFRFVTNWRLKPDDPLQQLVRKESDALDITCLFEGTTDRSRMGQVRKLWREHLGLDHAALTLVARVLAIAEAPESLASLRERLDDKFAVVGMKRVPAHEAAFFYDDLIVKLLAQGRIQFDRKSFREMAEREGLLDTSIEPNPVPITGIRSFMHPIDSLEERCQSILNIVPYFDGRYIRHDSDWQAKIFPELKSFLSASARSTDHLRLILDAHVSIAFAVGAVLNVKSGKHIEIEQRTAGRRFWSMEDTPLDLTWPKILFEEEHFAGGDGEIALAISLTHDVSPAVSTFVKLNMPQVSQILHCKPDGGPSQKAIRSGHHAWMLAESIVHRLGTLSKNGHTIRRVHIFLAGPNGFAFFLGQHQKAIGPVSVYEWDFDGLRGGGYGLGISI
jgi:hypothetical protein